MGTAAKLSGPPAAATADVASPMSHRRRRDRGSPAVTRLAPRGTALAKSHSPTSPTRSPPTGLSPVAADEDFDDDYDTVLFQGALSGEETDLGAHAKLVRVGLPRAKDLVSDALQRRAEKLRLEPKGSAAQVALYVDGQAFSGGRMSAKEAMAITQMLKVLAAMDPRERTAPQSGGIKAEYVETDYEIFVETTPTRGGERLVLKLVNQLARVDTPSEAGFTEELKELIREESATKNGVLLISGPPESGVSTAAIATLRSIDAYLFNIFNVADLGGREIIHVTNFEGEEGDGLEQKLARVIRKEADVCFVDPITEQTAPIVYESSEDICLLGELPAPSAADSLVQFAHWVGSRAQAAERLRMALAPKLIRRLCTECREAYRPNPKLVAKVGLPPETTVLYRQPKEIDEETGQQMPVDCQMCGGLGYYGRIAMIELCRLTDPVKQVFVDGGTPADLKAAAREDGQPTFRSEGVRLVAEGVTSLEELQRAFRK